MHKQAFRRPTFAFWKSTPTKSWAPQAAELQALAAVHAVPGRQQPLTLGSPTAQIGHLGGASGMPALIKASLEIEHAQKLPEVALERPTTALSNWGPCHIGWPIRRADQWPAAGCSGPLVARQRLLHDLGARLAGSDRAGQASAGGAKRAGGSQCRWREWRFEEWHGEIRGRGRIDQCSTGSEWKICRFGAASLEALLAKLDSAQADITAAWRAADATHFGAADRFRAAIVAENADALLRKLRLGRPQLANPAARSILEQQAFFYRELPAQAPRGGVRLPGPRLSIRRNAA